MRQRATGFRQLRQAEVQDLRSPVACDEDVLRLEIAMHDATLMGGGQAASPSGWRDRERRGVEGRSRQCRPQRLAFEEFRDDVGPGFFDPTSNTATTFG